MYLYFDYCELFWSTLGLLVAYICMQRIRKIGDETVAKEKIIMANVSSIVAIIIFTVALLFTIICQLKIF